MTSTSSSPPARPRHAALVPLDVVVFGLIAVAVVAWFRGLGFFVVSILRKRIAFIWPLAAIVVTVVLFYVGTWLAGLTFG